MAEILASRLLEPGLARSGGGARVRRYKPPPLHFTVPMEPLLKVWGGLGVVKEVGFVSFLVLQRFKVHRSQLLERMHVQSLAKTIVAD